MTSTLFVTYYKETEMLADLLIEKGFDIDKLQLKAKLTDEHSIVFDELRLRYDNIVIDGRYTEQIVRFSHLNHSHYYFLYYEGRDPLDETILNADYMPISVKDYENKTEDDWTEAAVLLGENLSESVVSIPSVRT